MAAPRWCSRTGRRWRGEHVLAGTSELVGRARFGPELLAGGGSSPLGCPACANVARAGKGAYDRIVRNIDERAVRDAYAEAGGLCLAGRAPAAAESDSGNALPRRRRPDRTEGAARSGDERRSGTARDGAR